MPIYISAGVQDMVFRPKYTLNQGSLPGSSPLNVLCGGDGGALRGDVLRPIGSSRRRRSARTLMGNSKISRRLKAGTPSFGSTRRPAALHYATTKPPEASARIASPTLTQRRG